MAGQPCCDEYTIYNIVLADEPDMCIHKVAGQPLFDKCAIDIMLLSYILYSMYKNILYGCPANYVYVYIHINIDFHIFAY
jgi:hypothetical protein